VHMLDLTNVITAFQEVLANKGELNPEVNADTALAGLGFDSLDFAEVLIVLEEHLGSELSLDRRIEGATIRDFYNMLVASLDTVA
jgi:acyl carrier protein